MKIAICFFSYEKDAALLWQALRGVKLLQGKYPEDVIDAYVYDDAAAPMGRDAVPECVHYALTDFDRKGNLNGLECVLGQLSVYAGLAAEGYEWVIKADSDTYINSLEWLREVDAEHVAHVGTCYREDYGSGSCYALSAAGIAALGVRLAEESVQRRVARALNEDKVFCRLSRMTGLGVDCRHNGKNEINERLLYQDWMTERVAIESLTGAAAVAFKRCVWHVGSEAWEDDRVFAEQRMKEYADYVEASACGADASENLLNQTNEIP